MALQYEQLKQEFVQEFSLENLSAAKQEEVLVQMIEILMKRIFVDTMEKLGESGVVEYEQFMEKKPSQEEIEDYLRQRIPNYDMALEKMVDDFKKTMKGE